VASTKNPADINSGDHKELCGSTPVLKPGTMLLLGIGLFGRAIVGKRRITKSPEICFSHSKTLSLA
jgi:hypothetical protein